MDFLLVFRNEPLVVTNNHWSEVSSALHCTRMKFKKKTKQLEEPKVKWRIDKVTNIRRKLEKFVFKLAYSEILSQNI